MFILAGGGQIQKKEKFDDGQMLVPKALEVDQLLSARRARRCSQFFRLGALEHNLNN